MIDYLKICGIGMEGRQEEQALASRLSCCPSERRGPGFAISWAIPTMGLASSRLEGKQSYEGRVG